MKRLFLCMGILVAITTLAESSEYRNFTNHEGKTINAMVVEYDSDADKVKLELKDHRSAWVEVSDLCETDQTYIRNINFSKTKPTTTQEETTPNVKPITELPREKIKEIAEIYILLLDGELSYEQRQDYKSLWTGDIGKFSVSILCHASIKEIEGNNVIIKYQNRTGYLQLTEDGKIKYDCVYRRHPIDRAFEACAWLENFITGNYDDKDSSYTNQQPRFHQQLIESNVPLFGYSLDQDDHENIDSLQQIKKWLLKEGKTWDISDPKLPLPEDIYKLHRSNYK